MTHNSSRTLAEGVSDVHRNSGCRGTRVLPQLVGFLNSLVQNFLLPLQKSGLY